MRREREASCSWDQKGAKRWRGGQGPVHRWLGLMRWVAQKAPGSCSQQPESQPARMLVRVTECNGMHLSLSPTPHTLIPFASSLQSLPSTTLRSRVRQHARLLRLLTTCSGLYLSCSKSLPPLHSDEQSSPPRRSRLGGHARRRVEAQPAALVTVHGRVSYVVFLLFSRACGPTYSPVQRYVSGQFLGPHGFALDLQS